MSSSKKEYSNSEEINKESILNFGSLSRVQNIRSLERGGSGVKQGEAWIKCKQCKNRRKVKWESATRAWIINNKDEVDKPEKEGGGIWKVYLVGTPVEKIKGIYQIGSSIIEFYCSVCNWRHNELWLKT